MFTIASVEMLLVNYDTPCPKVKFNSWWAESGDIDSEASAFMNRKCRGKLYGDCIPHAEAFEYHY